MQLSTRHPGFTLIELLLVIGIIAVLASIVIIAINPSAQLAKARDTQRRNDVRALIDAVIQYTIANAGALPVDIPIGLDNAAEICKESAEDCTGYADLGNLTPNFLDALPSDPAASALDTGSNYVIYRDDANHITVASMNPESESSISFTR